MSAFGSTARPWACRAALIEAGFAARPIWERLEADHDSFCQVLMHLLQTSGYQVLAVRVYQDCGEEAPRKCGMVLQRGDRQYLALGLRQNQIITSEVIGRLGHALQIGRVEAGLAITTSYYSYGAVQLARRQPIELYDREQLWRWINQTWT